MMFFCVNELKNKNVKLTKERLYLCSNKVYKYMVLNKNEQSDLKCLTVLLS